jgi:predicted adenine nucleotide alpha hydrolase (AANH) superfamily ATPase
MHDKELLLHTCCAPCSVKCIEALKDEGIRPTAFFFNPNIHPFLEYKNRLDALKEFSVRGDFELIIRGGYGLSAFLNTLNGCYSFPKRCETCYSARLLETAKYAAENGFLSFSTTLLISPYQNHELIKKISADAAEKYNTTFLYRDFRQLFKDGQNAARAAGFYMQKYCGCIFSEEERFNKKTKSH